MCVCLCECIQRGQKRASDLTDGFRGGWKPPAVGAGNQTGPSGRAAGTLLSHHSSLWCEF